MMPPDPRTIEQRLAKVGPLQKGGHSDHKTMCVMEAVAFVAGEPWSDAPECACPVISRFLREWNDRLPNAERDILLRPLIPRLIGTRGDSALEQRRAMMAVDWLIRIHTPAWLRLAKLDVHADALASLPEITDAGQSWSVMPALEAAGDAAGAAENAAETARAATRAAKAAMVARVVRVAAWAVWAAGDAGTVGAAAWAAENAAETARAALNEMQQSALALVHRMIEAAA